MKLKVFFKYIVDVLVLTIYIFVLSGLFLAIYAAVNGFDVSFTKELLINLTSTVFIVANVILFGQLAIDYLMSLFFTITSGYSLQYLAYGTVKV
jgi:hypothetical protein